MIKTVLRHYRPKIHFRKGLRSMPLVEVKEVEVETFQYEKPSYLSFKKRMTQDEIDLLNQGGSAPLVHWKKIPGITDIYAD